MKKSLWLVLIMMLVCVISLSACNENNDESQSQNGDNSSNESTHIHSFGDWKTDTEASCTTNGLQVRFCSGCTNVDTKEIQALGHTTSNGTCTRCYQQIGNSSNGNNNGNSAKENYSFNEKWIIDNEWEFEILSAEPHSACSTQTNAAQYIMITFRYKNIGNTNPNGLSFSEYDFNVYDLQGNLATSYFCYEHVKSNAFIDKGTTHTASAVFEFSQKTQTIKIVVKQYDSDYDLYKATFNGTITTCSHNVVTEKGYAATCQYEGVSDYKYCSKCGEVIAEKTSLPKAEHKWSTLSCTEARKCSVCKFSDGKKLDHNYSQGKCTMCQSPDPNHAYGIGEKWIVDGQWEFSIKSVTEHYLCNKYNNAAEGYTTEKVYIVEYTYKNVGYNEKLWFNGITDLDAYDSQGVSIDTYSCAHTVGMDQCVIGTTGSSKQAFVVASNGNSMTIYVSKETENANGESRELTAKFVIPLN